MCVGVGVGVGVGVSLQRIIYYARAGATAHTHAPFRTVWRDLRWSSHNNIVGPTAGLAGLIRVKKFLFLCSHLLRWDYVMQSRS